MRYLGYSYLPRQFVSFGCFSLFVRGGGWCGGIGCAWLVGSGVLGWWDRVCLAGWDGGLEAVGGGTHDKRCID